jgi:hypothetical protein
MISCGGESYLEIVEPVASPDGDFARRVALVELEVHVEHNKLPMFTRFRSERENQAPFEEN